MEVPRPQGQAKTGRTIVARRWRVSNQGHGNRPTHRAPQGVAAGMIRPRVRGWRRPVRSRRRAREPGRGLVRNHAYEAHFPRLAPRGKSPSARRHPSYRGGPPCPRTPWRTCVISPPSRSAELPSADFAGQRFQRISGTSAVPRPRYPRAGGVASCLRRNGTVIVGQTHDEIPHPASSFDLVTPVVVRSHSRARVSLSNARDLQRLPARRNRHRPSSNSMLGRAGRRDSSGGPLIEYEQSSARPSPASG